MIATRPRRLRLGRRATVGPARRGGGVSGPRRSAASTHRAPDAPPEAGTITSRGRGACRHARSARERRSIEGIPSSEQQALHGLGLGSRRAPPATRHQRALACTGVDLARAFVRGARRCPPRLCRRSARAASGTHVAEALVVPDCVFRSQLGQANTSGCPSTSTCTSRTLAVVDAVAAHWSAPRRGGG